MSEKEYEVYWEGPFKPKNIKEKIGDENIKKHVLYKIYGFHPLYGNNVLLYIGMTTEQGISKRLKHDYWMDEERYGESTIYVASIGKFKGWKESNTKLEAFEKQEEDVTKNIEALLIYAHQPAQNTKNKNSCKPGKIRIFNTGQFGSLMPEISGRHYWVDEIK